VKILWRRIDHPGLELFQFEASRTAISLKGLVLLTYGGTIYHIEYDILCSPDWRTESVSIKGKAGSKIVDMRISADPARRWYCNGRHVTAVDGCVDIDLGFSPSTNMLPLRRLHLVKGTTIKVTAAWVDFPSFKLKPLKQSYAKRGDRSVHYESADGKFQRDLEINSRGLVTRYPGFWEVEGLE
jgi:uncharacterized protein